MIKLQNCLFCCGVENIIVFLRRVNNLKRHLEIKSTQTKTHLRQLSPVVVFSSAKSLVLKDVMLSRSVIILQYFLKPCTHGSDLHICKFCIYANFAYVSKSIFCFAFTWLFKISRICQKLKFNSIKMIHISSNS